MLPYPGKYESHKSWMRRCDEYERWRNIANSQYKGLHGKPYKQGVCKNLSFIKIVNGINYEVVRVGYGRRASCAVEKWATKNGFDFVRENGNGCRGMCARYDGFALKKIVS